MASGKFAGLISCLPEGSVLDSESDLLSYSYDGALDRGRPDAVVIAANAEEVRRAVRWCAKHKVPFLARGAGTNLSGGCIAVKGGVVISLAQMNRILSIDTAKDIAVVEPGVVNLKLQEELAKSGYFYAPDPASFRVCTLGGNFAENAGGPRCLKYGVTSNHVLAADVVMPDGTLNHFSIEDDGPDVLGLFVGAEGTLGVATRIWLRIIPAPRTITTLLVGFPTLDDSIECVSAIIVRGVLPRVLEAMDRATVDSIEAYHPAGYPRCEAVLLIELDGETAKIEQDYRVVEELCRRHRCVELRRAANEAERERLWEGRRGAYAAVARIAPNVLVEDGVVPRGSLPEAFRRVRKIAAEHGAKVMMLFHAGDGNLHPNIAFDERNAEETRRVKKAGFEILRACVELGGSISGEHGIGLDKRGAMAWLFSPAALGLFRGIKSSLDPSGLSNPDKVIPPPSESQNQYFAPNLRKPSANSEKLIHQVISAARSNKRVALIGTGSRIKMPAGEFDVQISTRELTSVPELDRANYTATVEAGFSVSELKKKMENDGFYLPLADCGGTLGGLIASKQQPDLRDHILGMRLLLSSGEIVDLGGKVMKNVAGYDAAKLMFGSWGTLAVILEVTLKLYPSACRLPRIKRAASPFHPDVWHRRIKAAFDPENRLNPWVFK